MRYSRLGFLAAAVLGLSLPVHASERSDGWHFFAELRGGALLLEMSDDSEMLVQASGAAGVQLNRYLGLRGEYLRSIDDWEGIEWEILSFGVQLEWDAFRDGWGVYARLDSHDVESDDGIASESDRYLGGGGGVRYQFSSGHRVFLEGNGYHSELYALSVGYRHRF